MADIYSLEGLQNFVSEYISVFDSQPILSKGKSNEQYENAKARKESLGLYLTECSYGDSKAREFVKLFIKQLITAENREDEIQIVGYPNNYMVNQSNIRSFINLCDTNCLTVPLAFKIILHHFMKGHGSNALSQIIEKYQLYRLRTDEFLEQQFFINDEDIVTIFHNEKIELTYNDELDILVQIIYENYKGLGVVDEILEMNGIDEVSFGIAGLPNNSSIKSDKYKNVRIPRAYDSIDIVYAGNSTRLKFLSFGSWSELERVCKLSIKYEQAKELSQKQGFLLGYRKNGSRVTVAREPFGECWAAWIRNFHIKDVSFSQLVRGRNENKPIIGYEKVVNRQKLLMKGCATTSISGDQGLGKTTAMLSLVEFIYSFYNLRIIESVFEMMVRNRFPGRNIFTMQETETIDNTGAYNFSLRTSGTVTLVGETRDDKMIAQIINTGNRGSKFTLFTFHPNVADVCPLEMANGLLRLGMFSSISDALSAVLKTLKCNMQLSKNMETGDRYYELYEYVPYSIEYSQTYEGILEDKVKLLHYENELKYFKKMTESKFYRTVPLVEYDALLNRYVVINTISDELYKRLYSNMQNNEDRKELKKIFRPEQYIKEVLKNTKDYSSQAIVDVIVNHGIDAYEDIEKAAKELSCSLENVHEMD